MRNGLRAVLATALALVAPAALAVPDANTIEFSNCTLTLPGSPATAPARCGYLEVPEDPSAPDGRRIRLHVAVADAGSQTPRPDPLFFFAGGPGQAASETWVMVRQALRKVRKDRDIVMVDQRGTGKSNPLQCEPPEELDLNAEVDLEELAREAERCLESLDGDPRLYTTTIAMQDVDRVRRAMGYETINILGVSYGTRAAQVYLRQFPDTVRTMTLDSVVPMQLALGQEHAPMLDRAIGQVLDDCAADEACATGFPDPGDELTALLKELREEPRQIVITHPVTGEPQELRLSAETLAIALRFLSYSSETQAVLPLLIHEALSTGDLGRLAGQALLVMADISGMLYRGMELSVMCSEDYPWIDFDADYSDTILGNAMLEGIEAQCAVWPKGEVPADFHAPFRADTPTLLLSGQRDPVTPPSYADLAAEAYPNSLHLVAPGRAHSVLRNACLQEIATAFIEAGTLEGLDTGCVETIGPAPFFKTLLGPDP